MVRSSKINGQSLVYLNLDAWLIGKCLLDSLKALLQRESAMLAAIMTNTDNDVIKKRKSTHHDVVMTNSKGIKTPWENGCSHIIQVWRC